MKNILIFVAISSLIGTICGSNECAVILVIAGIGALFWPGDSSNKQENEED